MGMKHPVKGVEKARLWFGLEVEGRDQNYRTAFVRHALTADQDQQLRKKLDAGLDQIFLTEEFSDKDCVWLLKFLDTDHLEMPYLTITKACWPHEVRWWAKWRKQHKQDSLYLFVRIADAPWIHELQPSDQISIGVPYHLWSVERSEMAETKPNEYKRDKLK